MHNVCITGPAGSGKSAVGRLFAHERATVFVCTHDTQNIVVEPRALANPAGSALVLDECTHEALRRAEQKLAAFVEAGGRLVLITKTFSGIPLSLLGPLFKHGGLRDINIAVHHTGARPSFEERFACAPQLVLASEAVETP
ncbi:hypothetical protein [Paraburkholderia youngii]|uniref:hypothetical protein n=1 Tax=Paraburkholderia youngii TaxID=2782701 RepID=UPI003D1BD68A